VVSEAAHTPEVALSEAFLATLPDGALTFAPDGQCRSANQAAAILLGVPREQLIAENLLTVGPWKDAGLLRRAAETLKTGKEERWDTLFTSTAGKTLWMDVRLARMEIAGESMLLLVFADISERRRQQEERRQLLDGMNDMAFIVSLDGRFLEVNERATETLGYSNEEMLLMGPADVDALLGPDEIAGLITEHEEAGRGVFESRHRAKDGRVVPVEVSSRLVFLRGERAILSVARDMSERKQAEETLRESEERYRVLADATSDLIFSFDRNLRLTGINGAAARSLGLTAEEALGRSFAELGLPEETHRRWESLCAEVLANGEVRENMVGEMPFPGGIVRTIDTTLHPIYSVDGCVSGVRGMARDVTERRKAEEELRRSEERYRRLFESARDMLLTYDHKTLEILQTNGVATELLGYPRERLLAMKLTDLRTPEAARRLPAELAELRRRGHALFETTHRCADGSLLPVEVSSRLGKEEGREVVLSIVRDVSERKRSEEALAHAEAQLRQAQKMEAVGQLAGGIAHDFNNLLLAIIGNTELVLETLAAEDPNRELVTDIKAVGERAAALTRQILAFSRRQMLKPELICVNDVVERIKPLLSRTLGENIHLRVLLSPELAFTEVDPHQLEQVLMNLAVNARDAMPEGGELIVETGNVVLDRSYCRVHPELKAGAHVFLAVSDTGCGMDETTRSRIFEPFFTTKEVGRGTGLGLSTVLGIVQQSGGSISVYSELGRGTQFKVYLRAQGRAEHQDDPEAGAPEATTGTETVLVVEDEAPVRKLLTRVLARSGYQVLEAGSADEVAALLRSERPTLDLLLTDVVLPGAKSGHRVAEEVRELHPGLPVISMSGYTRDSAVFNGSLGADADFLEKPFTPDRLLGKVRAALDTGSERSSCPSSASTTTQ
jgi:two-component system, cell cycle sensor histidine kinase and response regulator CckA